MLKSPTSPSAHAASDALIPEVGQVGRQVRRDERDVEAAHEEAGDQQQVGAVPERLAQGRAQRQVVAGARPAPARPAPLSSVARSGTATSVPPAAAAPRYQP